MVPCNQVVTGGGALELDWTRCSRQKCQAVEAVHLNYKIIKHTWAHLGAPGQRAGTLTHSQNSSSVRLGTSFAR